MPFPYNWLDVSVFKTVFSTDMFHEECLLIWRETCAVGAFEVDCASKNK